MKLIRLWSSVALAVVVLLTGCCKSSAPTDVPGRRAAITANYPAVDGSTSAHPLQRTLACDLLGVPCTWSAQSEESVQRTIIPDPEQERPEQAGQAILEIKHNGTHGAYMNLIEDAVDVILVARAPSADELQAAQENGVSLDVRPVALDAFVFMVNVENPLESLPLDTLHDIYTGEITTWTELGVRVDPENEGEEPIQAYQRERNSGSQELMEKLVMQDTPMVDAPNMIVETMLGPFNAIGGNPWTGEGDVWGLGYSVYYYAGFMFPHEYVKLIGVDGVLPTSENIASGAYPLATEVYVAVRQDTSQDSTAIMFRDWLLSDDGQRVVEESGYVPLPE
jgi:phosphate transport system substrate-binding protein